MIYMFQLSISMTQAALGDEIEIPTLDGTKILLEVPAGTESGKILRISGKGTFAFFRLWKGEYVC